MNCRAAVTLALDIWRNEGLLRKYRHVDIRIGDTKGVAYVMPAIKKKSGGVVGTFAAQSPNIVLFIFGKKENAQYAKNQIRPLGRLPLIMSIERDE